MTTYSRISELTAAVSNQVSGGLSVRLLSLSMDQLTPTRTLHVRIRNAPMKMAAIVSGRCGVRGAAACFAGEQKARGIRGRQLPVSEHVLIAADGRPNREAAASMKTSLMKAAVCF